MITVPANYNSILSGTHIKQYKAVIDNVSYDNTTANTILIDGTMQRGLFEEFGIGTAVSRILNLEVSLTGDYSTVDLYYRLFQNSSSYTDWLPLGKFFVATQQNSAKGNLLLTCYDSMQKSNAIYMKTGTWDSPYSDELVSSIATKMGIQIETETATYLTANKFKIETGFVIGDEGTTMREFLCYIGAVHCGGFFIDNYGKLKLWRYGLGYNETSYLIDSVGDSITFGGDRILV